MAKNTEQRGDLVREDKLLDVLGAPVLDLRTLGTSEDEIALDMTGLGQEIKAPSGMKLVRHRRYL